MQNQPPEPIAQTKMNFADYRLIVRQIKAGKQLPTAIYLHQSALAKTLPPNLMAVIDQTIKALKIELPWNILKLYKRDFKATLLHYPDFDHTAYPPLHHSITIDLDEQTCRIAHYTKSDNPPILHRKEAFVLADYPLVDRFKAHTAEGEAIGLYKNTKTIGFRQHWQKLIKRKGYRLDEAGNLHPLAAVKQTAPVDPPPNQTIAIQRHLTAIDRNRLSAPFQKLAQHGYLNGQYSLFDYGCGKGDDTREIEAHGLDINSWDPVHNSSGQRVNSDIVNLGFVLNVIEDQHERQQTLLKAWQYTDRLLMVAVMLANPGKLEQFTPYKDGVITKRNTFQKYYGQGEIRSYIEQRLKTNAVAMGQGIFAIFKDKALEETFYLNRQSSSHSWQQYTTRPVKAAKPKVADKSLYQKHTELFNDFWQQCLIQGRLPANDEFECSDNLRAIIGSHKKAFELLTTRFEQNDFAKAQQQRKTDVLVYFALSLFEKRKAKSHMPARLQRDIKALFDSYNDAISQAQILLFSVGKPANIAQACETACQSYGYGKLTDNHSYTFRKAALNQMPAVIRVYVGCAIQLYGDLDDIDLIKVHIRSGKVTLLKYDDFEGKALPLLTERIKIRLIDLDIDFFIYGDEYPYQPLYDKSLYLDPASAAHKKQVAFEKRLAKQLVGLPLETLPDWNMLCRIVDFQGVELRGIGFMNPKVALWVLPLLSCE